MEKMDKISVKGLSIKWLNSRKSKQNFSQRVKWKILFIYIKNLGSTIL